LTKDYKHIAEITNRFKKAIKTLDEDLKKRISEKIEELLNSKIIGKPLRENTKGLKLFE